MATDFHKYTASELLNKVLSDDGAKLKCDNTVTQLDNVTIDDTGVIATMQDDIALMQADIAAIKVTTDKLDACINGSNQLEVKTY